MFQPLSLTVSLTLAVTLMAAPELQIQIVYDNTSADNSLREDWGFAAVVEFREQRILFDSGTDAELFMTNLGKLGIDPASITHAVTSHNHADHRNGFFRLGLKNHTMRAYFLDDFPPDIFELAFAVGIRPVRVREPLELFPGVYSTGIVEGNPSEQALIVETAKGLVMVTGCAHAGADRFVETAQKQRGKDELRLLVGGFHMLRQKDDGIEATISRLEALKVQSVAPTHCTGERAKQIFRQAFGERYLPAGAGRRIILE
ncbi:MAG: MBL fold metallo-hydrolase [Bryobacteraceae bacterium]|nr:MBL fold metallo-hydrolase [Bryobacteraceae bacterium]